MTDAYGNYLRPITFTSTLTVRVTTSSCSAFCYGGNVVFLAPELFFLILAHPVCKMWMKQEPNTLELWNKLHFEEKKTESIYHV